jgi:biotin carboxyl carrier protein
VDRRFVVSLDGHDWHVDAARVDSMTLSLLIDRPGDPAATATGSPPASASGGDTASSREVTLTTHAASGRITVSVGAVPVTVTLNGRRRWSRSDQASPASGGPQRLVAPMPGKIVRILVAPGQAVTKRQPLVVIEAMKMENELRASADGVVTELPVQEGQSVDAGTLLAVLVPA